MAKTIKIYDTTLRDGAQAEEVSFSLDDKLRLAEALDDFGISYIEGGWPGSNPKDAAFFVEVKKLNLKKSRIAAFGSTHHPKNSPDTDSNVKTLLKADSPVVTVVGKTWDMHAKTVLKVSPNRNLEIVHDTIRYLKKRVDEVIFDAEHFFDGYKANREYALSALKAAIDGGADLICLCETNGGALPFEIAPVVTDVAKTFPSAKVGIHCHNDSDTAIANTIEAVRAGAIHVQGTINGIGERCGNANLISIVSNLQIKMGYKCVPPSKLKKQRELSLLVFELANMARRPHQPYVGRSAFAHKGGIHVAAVRKSSLTYEHIEPETVGNKRRILVSDLSGRGNILSKAEEFGFDLKATDPGAKEILEKLKEMENQGYQFEGAEASFELLMRKTLGQWKKKFDVERARVVSNFSDLKGSNWAEAVIKVRLPDGETAHAVAEGNGPVNALDKAIRQALVNYYPQLADVELHDFKVRLIDESAKTAAITRVLIESGDKNGRWATMGLSPNVIEAAWMALVDSLEYRLHRPNANSGTRKKKSASKKA